MVQQRIILSLLLFLLILDLPRARVLLLLLLDILICVEIHRAFAVQGQILRDFLALLAQICGGSFAVDNFGLLGFLWLALLIRQFLLLLPKVRIKLLIVC